MNCDHKEVEYIRRSVWKYFIYRCIECNTIGESSIGHNGVYQAGKIIRSPEGTYQTFVKREVR
jgi:hypothetical protein